MPNHIYAWELYYCISFNKIRNWPIQFPLFYSSSLKLFSVASSAIVVFAPLTIMPMKISIQFPLFCSSSLKLFSVAYSTIVVFAYNPSLIIMPMKTSIKFPLFCSTPLKLFSVASSTIMVFAHNSSLTIMPMKFLKHRKQRLLITKGKNLTQLNHKKC